MSKKSKKITSIFESIKILTDSQEHNGTDIHLFLKKFYSISFLSEIIIYTIIIKL